jgi:hypothetical protein
LVPLRLSRSRCLKSYGLPPLLAMQQKRTRRRGE